MVASIPMAFFPGSPKRPSHKRMDSLPQHGFGSDTSFASLLDTNPFLFRVYTPKSRAHDAGASDPFFLGAKFDDEDEASFSDAEMTMSDTASDFSGSISNISETTYADVIRHLDWRRRSSSPYVSTTFSFAWAIWEASRRYQDGVKHDVHIAIIDARALAGRAITSAELLRKGTTAERRRNSKFHRFATEAQNVLVFGCIPSTAVIASVPLVSVLPKLPTYFQRETTATGPRHPKEPTVLTPPPSPTPFATVFKDASKKPSYKLFCQELSERFLRESEEQRLEDTSSGAVRLAVALLRPWLHRSLPDADSEDIATKIEELALIIAQWPAQWWARDRREIEGLVRGMAQVVSEEVKETRRIQTLREVDRLQDIVSDLQDAVQSCQDQQSKSSLTTQSSSSSSTGTIPPSLYASVWVTGPPPKLQEQKTSLPPVASALISGLLFGTFCMLSVIHSQRWELATHLT